MMTDQEKRQIAVAIREHIARTHMSREAFAFKTKLGKSTVDKLLIGLFSHRTLSIVEEAIGVRFRNFLVVEERADPSLGGYLRSDMAIYEGDYLFVRPSFRVERSIFTFRMSIGWEDDPAGLVLKHDANGHGQSGSIFVPKVSFHIFVASSDATCTRHLILSRMDSGLKLKGLMLTLANTFANAYAPVSVPVVLIKQEQVNDSELGRIEVEHPAYATLKESLLLAEQEGFYVQIDAKKL